MLFRQRVKTVTHVAELLNFVQDRTRMHGVRRLLNPVKALYWTAVINGLLAPLPSRRNPGRRFGQETDAGPTEFTLGMDRGGDHHSGNVCRGRSHVCCLARLAKLGRSAKSEANPASFRDLL